MNPSALDRTAAWLLNMNAQYLEQEGIDPDSKHREDLFNKDELSQTEKVTPITLMHIIYYDSETSIIPPL